MYQPAGAFYTQDLVTIIQVEIGFVFCKDLVNLIDQHGRMIVAFYIGFKDFYHTEKLRGAQGNSNNSKNFSKILTEFLFLQVENDNIRG